MTDVLCDASVVVKWFRDEPGEQTGHARGLMERGREGAVKLHVLDLTEYEVGQTFVKLGVGEEIVAAVLGDVRGLCGPGVGLGERGRVAAATIAVHDGLSFYDAAYVAVAHERGWALTSADRAMIRAGGRLPGDLMEALG